MIFNNFKILFVTCVLCIALPISAIFHTVEQWVNEQGNIIECFLDQHHECDNKIVSKRQHNALLKEAKKRAAHVIVEDLNNYDGDIKAVADYVATTTAEETPLFAVIADCKKAGISCYNVEFRHASTAALEGEIKEITCATIMHIVDGMAKEIKSYKDDAMLNQYYAKVVDSMYANYESLLDRLRKYNGSVHEFFNTLSSREQDACGHKFDFELINARILHQIYRHRNTKHIFVSAGGDHIRWISDMLSAMGYSQRTSASNSVRYVQKDPPILNSSTAVDLDHYFTHPEQYVVTSALAKVGYVVGAAVAAMGAYKAYQWLQGTEEKKKQDVKVQEKVQQQSVAQDKKTKEIAAQQQPASSLQNDEQEAYERSLIYNGF